MGVFNNLAWLVADPIEVVEDRPWLNPSLDLIFDQVPGLGPEAAVERALDHLRPLRDRPEEHVQAVSVLGDLLPSALDELHARVRGLSTQNEDAADLWALLGRTLIEHAWQIRGSGSASTVQESAWPQFHALLVEADEAFRAALEASPGHPAAAAFRLTTARALGAPMQEWQERFDTARLVRGTLFHAHSLMLTALCAKWAGSDELMFDFGRTVAASAPAGDPVVAMLPLAHAEYICSIDMGRSTPGGPSAARARAADLDEVLAASLKWCGEGPVPPHPYDVEAHNLFGWFLGVSREHQDRGRWHLEQAQRRMARYPWIYLASDPKREFSNRHAKLGISG